MNRFTKEFLKSVVLGCVLFLVLQGINLIAGTKLVFDDIFLYRFLMTMLYTVSIYMVNASVFIMLDSRFKNDRFPVKRLSIGFLISFTATVVIIFMLRILEEVYIENKSFDEFWHNERLANYLVAIIVYLFVSLFMHAVYFYKALQEKKFKEQKIIAGTASAKFESLKNQIDPHFLFNSLNVLSSLIEENPDNAQRFTTSLSKIYRYVLEQKDKDLVSVEEELQFAKIYMDLLKMRFEDSLTYEVDNDVPNPEARVVPLSLQLLLENTVKHNVVSQKRPLHIKITVDNDMLCITNNYQKKEVLQGKQGVGLQNIISRYGIITKRKVLITQSENEFTVKIPILTKQVSIMENDFYDKNAAYLRAQKKVEDIKGFYGHLMSYVIVMLALAIINFTATPSYLWFLWPALGWGVGVAVHAVTVFNYMPFLSSEWEEKKITEMLEKENKSEWK